jgi:hypothetical protein
MKLTAEQRIEKAHVALMQEKLFCQFSGVFMVGKIEVVDRPMTAMTNGRDVTYGREFVESLADKELNFSYCPRGNAQSVSTLNNVEAPC